MHDYLAQRGGAERVVLSMMRAFPQARLITTVYAPERTFPEYRAFDIQTTGLDRFPLFHRDTRKALPFLAHAVSTIEVSDVDLVVCSSSGWAHAVQSLAAPKLVYCHSPARWLYEVDDYFGSYPPLVRRGAARALTPLRRWDQRAAASADRYLVNSSVVQRRVRSAYGREATIVFPPLGLGEGPTEPVPGIEPGFLLTVSRRRSYKQVDVVCAAVEEATDRRLVVVGGLPERPEGSWCPRLTGLSDVSDAQLRWLYANCAALVATSNEDFGLTPIEAYAAGRPALVLRRGGYLDSSRDGLTGLFIEEPTVRSVAETLSRFHPEDFDPAEIRAHAEHFSEARFIERMRAEAWNLLNSEPG